MVQFFYFNPYLGKISNFTNIFQMGWFNHQLDIADVSEIPHIHLGCINLVNNGIYQPQPVSRISEPSRVWASSSHFLTSSRCFFNCFFWDIFMFLRETQHTPGAYPRPPQTPNERNSFIKCWFWVWGMFQGYVGKFLEFMFKHPVDVRMPIGLELTFLCLWKTP